MQADRQVDLYRPVPDSSTSHNVPLIAWQSPPLLEVEIQVARQANQEVEWSDLALSLPQC